MNTQQIERISLGAVIVGSLIVSVLLYQKEITYRDDRASNSSGFQLELMVFKGYWKLVLVMYTLPGIFALFASFVQTRWKYVMTCINASMSIYIIGPFIINYYGFFYFVVFENARISNYCIDANGTCACRYDKTSYMDTYTPTAFKTCADLENYVNEKYDKVTMTLVFIFLVLFVVYDLEELVSGCYYACRRKPTARRVIVSFRMGILLPVSYLIIRRLEEVSRLWPMISSSGKRLNHKNVMMKRK